MAANRDRLADTARRYRYRKKYKLTEAGLAALIAAQGGKCKICGDAMPRPHVDHCHKTNKVRGVLCCRCNIGLGMFRDSVSRLKAAAAYLADAERTGRRA